jgi:hypothetical protein
MSQRAFIKLEKKLACDLKPGELFVPEQISQHNMEGPSPVISAFLRTNMPSEEFSDMETLVYKVHIVLVDPEDPAPPKLDPHSPPGMKENGRGGKTS